jgi:hypothetical protein
LCAITTKTTAKKQIFARISKCGMQAARKIVKCVA